LERRMEELDDIDMDTSVYDKADKADEIEEDEEEESGAGPSRRRRRREQDSPIDEENALESRTVRPAPKTRSMKSRIAKNPSALPALPPRK
jgi:hypothetical protein